jgi:hypothetical protein
MIPNFKSLYESIMKSWNEFWEVCTAEDIEKMKEDVKPCML